MGSIIAKLDSNNKVLSIKSDGKKLLKDDIDKIKNFYNKHGVIKVRIDMNQMDLFIQNYMKKISKTSVKLEAAIKQNMRMSIGLGLMLISNNGFVMMVNNENIKSIDGFNDIEGFDDIEDFALVNKSEEESTSKSDVVFSANDFEIQSIKSKPEIKSETKSEIKSETKQTNIDKVPFVDVIIPKVLLSSERSNFIDFISKLFAEDTTTKIVYTSFKKILEGIMVGSNHEIKIANLIGLSMRVAIMAGIAFEAKKLGPNNFTQTDMINFTSQVIADFMADFPNDKCSFYNNKLNFIKFTPNICNVKNINNVKQEACPKCSDCKETICNCLVKTQPVVLPEMKCPPIVLPVMKCPPIVIPEMRCPPIVIPEIKSPNITIPEMKCPPVVIPKMKCPRAPKNSNMWKVSTIIFMLLIVGLIVLITMNKDESNNLSLGKISNLAKLN